MRYIPMTHLPKRHRYSYKFLKKILIFLLFVFLFGMFFFLDYFHYQLLYRQSLSLFQRTLYVSPDDIKSIEMTRNIESSWHFIGDPKFRFQIYSAFFDDRLEIVENYNAPKNQFPVGSIRIIAILPMNIVRSSISCNLRYHQSFIRKYRPISVSFIHENFNMPFAASFIVCPLLQKTYYREAELPESVGISYDEEIELMNATEFTVIRYPQFQHNSLMAPKQEDKLAICVGPAQNVFSNVLRVVEFVEIYRLMGASKFYFYNNSISEDVDLVFKYYQSQGLVEVLNWNLAGYKFEEDLRYGGIFASLNDCIYRASIVDNIKYSAVVDFDEIIVPFRWTSLLSFLERNDKDLISSFNFQNVFFFYMQDGNFSNIPQDATNTFLYTQVQTIRTSDPLPHHTRSKYIAKGKSVIELGNHKIYEGISDTSEYLVSQEEGLLYHYRDDCVLNYCDQSMETDDRARVYGEILWKRVDQVCENLFESHICSMK